MWEYLATKKTAIGGVVILVGLGLTLWRVAWGKTPIKKKSMIDLIGNTPLVYIHSLSEALHCQIFVPDV